MRTSYSSSSSFFDSRLRSQGFPSLMQSQISISCTSPSFSCVRPSSSANFRNRMSCGSFTCSNSPSSGSSLYSTRIRSSPSIPSTFRSSAFSLFSCPPGNLRSASPFSRFRPCTFFARKALTAITSFELLSWMIPFSSRSPWWIRLRFSKHPCSSFFSAPLSPPLDSFFRTSRLFRLVFEVSVLTGGSGLYPSCLYPSEGVRYRLRTSSVMMEVKVVFFENGLPAVLGFSSSSWGLRSVSSSSSHPIRLKWSFTSIFLSSSSVLREILTLAGKVMVDSSMREISRAMVFSSKGQKPQSISYSTTPRDQMSAFMVQASPLRTQGAIYMGEPSMVWERSLASLRGLQKPKSASLMIPLLRRMLLGLMSRCMMLNLMRIWKALRRSLKQPIDFSSLNLPAPLISCSRVPPLQNSQTKQQLLAVLRISMNRTT